MARFVIKQSQPDGQFIAWFVPADGGPARMVEGEVKSVRSRAALGDMLRAGHDVTFDSVDDQNAFDQTFPA